MTPELQEECTAGEGGGPLYRQAPRDGSSWRLDGVKMCVPAADLAERLLISARTGDDTLGMFLLDPKGAGVQLERQETTQGEPQFRVILTGAAVETDSVLGDALRGRAIMEWMVDRAVAARTRSLFPSRHAGLHACAGQASSATRQTWLRGEAWSRARSGYARPNLVRAGRSCNTETRDDPG
jgi:hypothetical protein